MSFIVSKRLEAIAEVNKEDKTMRFVIGTPSPVFSYMDITSCNLVYEDASAHKESSPFEKRVVVGVMQPEVLFTKYVYVGVKVVLKNGDVMYGYAHDKKLAVDTLDFYKYKKVAQNVVDVLKEQIKK